MGARLNAVNNASEAWPISTVFGVWAPAIVGPQIDAMPMVETGVCEPTGARRAIKSDNLGASL